MAFTKPQWLAIYFDNNWVGLALCRYDLRYENQKSIWVNYSDRVAFKHLAHLQLGNHDCVLSPRDAFDLNTVFFTVLHCSPGG